MYRFPTRSVVTYKHNFSVNKAKRYFIYNENCMLSGWHVSTFIRPSSDRLRINFNTVFYTQLILIYHHLR